MPTNAPTDASGPKGRHPLAQPNGLGVIVPTFMRPEGPRQPTIAMPQSLSRILIHLVFSTKNREPLLTPPIQTELHPYLAGVLDNIECPSLQVGGVEDHVHLFFGLSRTVTIAQVVEKVKTSSSKWLKTKSPALAEFHWQQGYGAFSVSRSDADAVVMYVREQAKHHHKMSFQDEYRALLKKYEVPYDEKYVWD